MSAPEAARLLFYYASQQFDTGSPKALVSQLELLDRARFTPLFLASGEGPLLDALAARDVEILRRPVSTVTWRRPLASWRALRAQMAFLRSHRIDLLHVNEMGWNFDIVLAAWALSIPVVLQLHLPGGVAFQNLHRFAARRVLLVSRSHRSAIAHVERFHGQIEVLYGPVDVDLYRAARSIRPSLGLQPEHIVVCVVAQLRAGKGIDVALDAARRLAADYPQLRFLMVGPPGRGEEEFGQRMMAEAERPPLAGVVHFLGSRQDVPDILASSDVFLLPTHAETFGRVVIEAMAAGKPVVASRIPVIEEIVTSSDLGILVSPRTGVAFADALRSVIARTDRGRTMGERGRESLTGRFDQATVARQLNEMYADMTVASSGRTPSVSVR